MENMVPMETTSKDTVKTSMDNDSAPVNEYKNNVIHNNTEHNDCAAADTYGNYIIQNRAQDNDSAPVIAYENYPDHDYTEDVDVTYDEEEDSTSTTKTSYIDEAVSSAISRGDPELLKLILNENPWYTIRKDAIALVMPRFKYFIVRCDYVHCLNIIMKAIPQQQLHNYVNYRGADGKLPLEQLANVYDGIRYMCIRSDAKEMNIEHIFHKLIKAGASLADEDESGLMIIQKFRYGQLKRMLDTRIIKLQYDYTEFNFINLLPSTLDESGDVDVFRILLYINNTYSLRDLLMHPLISMFLLHLSYAKWFDLYHIYYIDLIFYLIFYSSILLQVANFYIPIGNVWLYVLPTTCLLAAREILQIIISPKLYFKHAENYLGILIVAFITTASFINNRNVTDQLVVFAFLFSTFELLLLAGRHIKLIKYILLFKTVLKIFLKLFAFFIIIIVSFAISFNILLSPQTQPNSNDTVKIFESPLISMFKTVIMTSGEYESGSINFNNHPIGSHIALLLFIIIVSIILMNIILGLAISDIQRMEAHSKLYGQFATIEFLHQVETIIRHPKLRSTFNQLGRIHKSLNLFDRLCKDTQIMARRTVENNNSKLFNLITQLSPEQDQREQVLRLTQMVEDIHKYTARAAGEP